eukprot:1145236-Pelagomonas_calceolata.AAC.2
MLFTIVQATQCQACMRASCEHDNKGKSTGAFLGGSTAEMVFTQAGSCMGQAYVLEVQVPQSNQPRGTGCSEPLRQGVML